MGVTDVREFYAFISYKRGCNDEVWAKSLYHHLIGWHIPIEIPDDLRLNMTERIDPIFKDKDNLSGDGGNLDLKLKEALANSRTLVLILSRRMYEAERSKIKNSETPYIFKEVEYFIEELGHSTNDVIIVYIDNDIYNPEILPPSLLNESNINVVNVNDYIKEKDYKKHTAAKVAAGIFHSDKDIFWRYHERILKEQRKRNLVVLFSIVLILGVVFGGFYFSARQSTKTAEAFRLIELSKQAYNKGDVQAAKILSIEAYDKKPSLEDTRENLWKYSIDDYSKPFATIPSGVVISNSGKEIMYLEDDYLVIKDSYTLENIERIYISQPMLIQRTVYSKDDSKIAIVRDDSVKIYDRNKKKFIYSEYSNWLMRGIQLGRNVSFCNNDKNLIITYYGEDIINFDIENNDVFSTKISGIATNHLYSIDNNIYIELADESGFGLYQYDFINNKIDTITRIAQDLGGWGIDYKYHPLTKHCIFSKKDTMYRLNSKQEIIFKTPNCPSVYNVHFSPDGNNLIWNDDDNIFICDSIGQYKNLNLGFYIDNIEELEWISDDSFVCKMRHSDNSKDICLISIKSGSQITCNIKLSDFSDSYYIRDSLLIETNQTYDIELHIYNINNNKTSIIHLNQYNDSYRYSPNGKYVITLCEGYNKWQQKIKIITCKTIAEDSTLWTKIAYSEYLDLEDMKISNNFVSYGFNDWKDIIDINTGESINVRGKIVYSDDDLIIYERNDSLHLQGLCKNQNNGGNLTYVHNRLEKYEHRFGIRKFDILAIVHNKILYVINVPSLSIIKQIDVGGDSDDIRGGDIQISLDGQYVVFVQRNKNNIIIYNTEQDECFHYAIPVSEINEDVECHSCTITNSNKLIFTSFLEGKLYIYDLRSKQLEKCLKLGFMPTDLIDLNDKEIILPDLDYNNYVLNKKTWMLTSRYKYTGGITIYNDKYMKVGNLLIDRERDKIIRRTDETIRYITDSVIVFERSDNYHQEREFLVPMENVQQFRDRLKAQVGNRQLSEWEMRRFAKEE